MPDLLVIDSERDGDQRIVQHPLEHFGIAVRRHRLMLVGEIAVVGIGPGRNPGGHRLVELARVEAPLLARVALEKQFVELAADGVDDHVLGGADVGDRLGAGGEELRRLLVGLKAGVE